MLVTNDIRPDEATQAVLAQHKENGPEKRILKINFS